ncbi:hypothetical protein QYF36_022550 [Acer negundo]|nr:hypothetical protein QYF36_022550 [Acer negundo]
MCRTQIFDSQGSEQQRSSDSSLRYSFPQAFNALFKPRQGFYLYFLVSSDIHIDYKLWRNHIHVMKAL